MAIGIKVMNPDGSLQFDTTNRLYRLLAITDTGILDGDVVVSDLSQGALAVTQVESASDAGSAKRPKITMDGATVRWSFENAPSNKRVPVKLLIGVY